MKVKLEERFAFVREDGESQNFFGVTFTCQNKEFGEGKIKSEWFADVEAKDAKVMEKLGRVEIIKDK